MAVFDTSTSAQYIDKLSFATNFVRKGPAGVAPLFAMTSALSNGAMDITNITDGYFTKTMVFGSVTLTAAVADGVATTFTVADTSKITQGMLLRANTTGEIVQVLTIPNATSFTCTRGVGNITAAAIANGVVLYAVGNASEEASTRPSAQRITETYVLNNTQIFRNCWLLSGTQAAVATIAGTGHVAEDKADCAAFHSLAIEQALLFGQKSMTTKNGQRFHTMDGLESSIRQYAPGNIATAGGTTTLDQLEAMVDPCFNVQTDPKVGNLRTAYVGSTAFKVVNKIGRLSGSYTLEHDRTEFGLQFATFRTSRGVFQMIEHPLLNSNADWMKMMVVVDLSTIKLAYLRRTMNRPIGVNGYIENSLDAIGGELLTEMTLRCTNPAANAIIYGLTAGA